MSEGLLDIEEGTCFLTVLVWPEINFLAVHYFIGSICVFSHILGPTVNDSFVYIIPKGKKCLCNLSLPQKWLLNKFLVKCFLFVSSKNIYKSIKYDTFALEAYLDLFNRLYFEHKVSIYCIVIKMSFIHVSEKAFIS